MFTATDHALMARALRLAEQGLYTTMPNPRVGCVIARGEQIVGEGAHLKAGEPHAEVFALRQAGELAKGATAYVTLEPCSHHGRTPPCAEALLQAGVVRVVAAMQDPNPLVAGNGLAYLKQHGIHTEVSLMQAQAEALNLGFISRMRDQKPFVRSKVATSLDGKTALNNGESQWITGAASRRDVQHWRAQSCAILTGVGTVLADNPQMTVRDIPLQRQPLRVIVDSRLRTPLNAQILQEGRTLIAFAYDENDQADCLFNAGAELLCIPNAQGQVDLEGLLRHLAANEINELMVEAGAHLNGALLSQRLIDECLIYYALKVMGGGAQEMFSMAPFSAMIQAIDLTLTDVRQFGNDLRVRAIPQYAD